MNRKNILSAAFAALIVCAFSAPSAFAKDGAAKPASCCAMACCKPGAACCQAGASCCGASCCGSGCCGTSGKKQIVAAKKAKTAPKTFASVAPRN